MFTQHRIINSKYFVFSTIVLGFYWIAIASARNLENSKNELGDNALNGGSSGSGKINNNQFNAGSASAYFNARHNLRSMLIAPKEYQHKFHSKTPLNLDLMDFLLEYEDEDRSKRFDDYGHMRFGKRGGEEQFDDYGHMRFGRSV